VTPEDVIFSFEKSKELNPLLSNYYGHVVKAEKTGERDVTFAFDEKNNKELPNILGQLHRAQAWWEGKDPTASRVTSPRRRLSPSWVPAPTRSAPFQPGSKIRYELRDDYWGKDLNVNVGQNNFGASPTPTSVTGMSSSRRSAPATWISGRRTRRAAGRRDMTSRRQGRTGQARRTAEPASRDRHHAGYGAEHAPRHIQG
jgi:hypothetical protein